MKGDDDLFARSPCTDPATRDDWFIEPGEKLEEGEIAAIRTQVEVDMTEWRQVFEGHTTADPQPHIEAEVRRRVEEIELDRAQRRRAAIAKCYFDCPTEARLTCLFMALEGGEKHGIWGGYTERERARMIREIRAKDHRHRATLVIDPERAAAYEQDAEMSRGEPVPDDQSEGSTPASQD